MSIQVHLSGRGVCPQVHWPEMSSLAGRPPLDKYAWPPVKRPLPGCAGRIRGCSLPTTTCQPIPGHKADSASRSHPILSETQHDSNKESVNDHLLRHTGSISCGALHGSSRSKNSPQDWASTDQFPQPGRGTAFVKQEHR